MSDCPELVIGDVVIVYVRRKDKFNVTSIVVNSVARNASVWEYNYDTPDAFHYSDVEYILRRGKWKRR